jgi:hypothetical protein
MTKTTEENHQSDNEALFEELSIRYGCAIAQDIIDHINLAKENTGEPDYMPVKASSEMLELFRGEARELLAQLKAGRDKWGAKGAKISFIEKRKLEAEFRHIYRLYWVSMKQFYPLFDDAMAFYRKKHNARISKSRSTKMSMAA